MRFADICRLPRALLDATDPSQRVPRVHPHFPLLLVLLQGASATGGSEVPGPAASAPGRLPLARKFTDILGAKKHLASEHGDHRLICFASATVMRQKYRAPQTRRWLVRERSLARHLPSDQRASGNGRQLDDATTIATSARGDMMLIEKVTFEASSSRSSRIVGPPGGVSWILPTGERNLHELNC